MNAKETNDLKVFEMMASGNEYFEINVDENYMTIFIKKTNADMQINLKKVKKVNIMSPYRISIISESNAYVFISLLTGNISVSI